MSEPFVGYSYATKPTIDVVADSHSFPERPFNGGPPPDQGDTSDTFPQVRAKRSFSAPTLSVLTDEGLRPVTTVSHVHRRPKDRSCFR